MTDIAEVTQADRDLVHKIHVQVNGNYGDPAQDVADYRHDATRELAEAVRPIIRYHSSGGHEGDGSDAAIKRAENALAKHTEATQ